ncbi:MAG: oxidoreductase, partial [Myxococcales bacterium]|nr:oxidoreductase [Myxococcales bacterium]
RLSQAVLRAPGVNLISKNQRAMVDLLATDVRYDTTQADELLRGSGIHCPSLDSYIEELVSYVQRRLREERARSEARVEALEVPPR